MYNDYKFTVVNHRSCNCKFQINFVVQLGLLFFLLVTYLPGDIVQSLFESEKVSV